MGLYSNLDSAFFHLLRRSLRETQIGALTYRHGQMNHVLIADYQQNGYKCVGKAKKIIAIDERKVLIFSVYF